MIIVISHSEDGETYITSYKTEKQFLSTLTEEDWGGPLEFISPEEVGRYTDASDLFGRLLVIRGSIVVPQPKQVVKEWEIPE